MKMTTANSSTEDMARCAKFLKIEVDGLKTLAHAFVVLNAPYHLLLGCPWQNSVKMNKIEHDNGVDITIHSPLHPNDTCQVLTHAWTSKPNSPVSSILTSVVEQQLASNEANILLYKLVIVKSAQFRPPCLKNAKSVVAFLKIHFTPYQIFSPTYLTCHPEFILPWNGWKPYKSSTTSFFGLKKES